MSHSNAEREAGFLRVWEAIKPPESDFSSFVVTKEDLRSLLYRAYITGWLDAEIHADENGEAA